MIKLPIISGFQALKAFEKDNWNYIRMARSNHYLLKKEGISSNLSIPNHKKLDRGLLKALIRDAGLTVEEFINLLD